MKVIYHVALNWTNEKIQILNRYGLYPKVGHTSIQIEEDNYYRLERILIKWGAKGVRYPLFTKKELEESMISAKIGSHTQGYPMPDMNDGYLNLTYDLTNYCKSCGIGLKQKDAFRLKNVPKENIKKVFEVEWVHDELFVEKGLYDEVFKPFGIRCREVLKYKKETPFDTHVQLVLKETEEELNIKNNSIESCDKCGKCKYQPMPQDFYPRYNNIIAPIFKSKEYFGSGASADKRIFITKELRDKLIESKIEKEQWYIPTKR